MNPIKLFFVILFLFLFSCATTPAVSEMPKEDITSVRVTKIGGSNMQSPSTSFVLVPGTLEVEIPSDTDTVVSVNVVNCKDELLLVSVSPQTISEFITVMPAFIIKAFEIKRVDFTLMPYKVKNFPGGFLITFKAKESVQNLKLKVKVAKSQNTGAAKKQVVQPTPTKEVGKKSVEVPQVKRFVRQILFSVHIASFKKREDALDFVDSLPNLEPKVSVILYDLGSKGLWYRVFIGLYDSQNIAIRVAEHFRDFFGWTYATPLQVYEDSFLRGEVKERRR